MKASSSSLPWKQIPERNSIGFPAQQNFTVVVVVALKYSGWQRGIHNLPFGLKF